jgi:SAM-dependent methyltransferase
VSPAIRACRSCGAGELTLVLSLGDMPLANALLTAADLGRPEPRYPLDLVVCTGCSLVQITETVSPEVLFREYLYFSSVSEGALKHARQLAERVLAGRPWGPEPLVMEIASNDGYLLQHYRARGMRVLGIEPARNVAKVAEERGIPTVTEFFGRALALQLREAGDTADVLHAHNVLAHVADPNDVVGGMAVALRPGGVIVVEVPYVRDLLERVEFDTIYHEHLCYFSLSALDRLFERHRLRIAGVERIPVHGGSLRLFVERADSPGEDPWRARPLVDELLAEEAAWGVHGPAVYRSFGDRVGRLRDELVALVNRLRGEGRRIAVYGASAKSCILLNHCGIGGEALEFVVDRSPVKQGRFTPGTHLPIHPPEKLLAAQPDYVLLSAWNLADEVLAQQAEYRRRGGRFIVPVPAVSIV